MLDKILQRPVTIIMFFISIVILGLISFYNIPLELKPDTQYPNLKVYARWNNVSPETMETKVISPVESQVYTLENIHKVTSSSESGRGTITIEYKRDTDMNFAYLALNEKLFQVRKDLPEAVRNSVFIMKYVPRDELDESRELVSYNIFGNLSLDETGMIIENELKNEILSIEGINSVEINGIPENEIRVLVDREKAEFYKISTSVLNYILYQLDNTTNAGTVEGNDKNYEFSVTINNKFKNLNDINNAVVDYRNGIPIKISDIAEVVIAKKDPTSINRINGKASVNVVIMKEPGANAITTADLVDKAVQNFREKHNDGSIEAEVNFDSTETIREELDDIKVRALFSIVVIMLVLMIFLLNVKLSIVVIISVALSLLMSGFLLYFANYSLNIVTLSGLILSFGLLVDNSVVVLENIIRLFNEGMDKVRASIEGTKEVILPVVSSTLTTLVVFIPFLYMSGERRLYWIPLAVAVGTSLLSSLLVSITFIPILTRIFLTEKYRNKAMKKVNGSFKGYKKFLTVFINNRKIVLILTGVIFYLSYFLFQNYVDQGRRFNWNPENSVYLRIHMPVGSTIDMTEKIIEKFEKRVLEVGGYKSFTTDIYPTYVSLQVNYTEEQFYSIAPFDMENEMVSMAVNFQGPFISIYNPLNSSSSYRSGGTTSKSYNSTLRLKGFSYEGLKEEALKLEKYLLSDRRVSEVDIAATNRWWRSSDMFNYTININRRKLADYDINIRDLVFEILASSGSRGRSILFNEEEIEMNIKYSDYDEFNIKDLMDKIIYSQGRGFRVKEIAEIKKFPVMSEIEKEDQSYTRYIRYDYNSSSKQVEQFKTSIEETYPLPAGYEFDTTDDRFMTDEEEEEVMGLLLLAIILVFMVTASLFESLLHPFVIILSIPLSLAGVFLIFLVLGEHFGEDAYMGVILLEGIVVNNSIILIYHINTKRKQGLDLMNAIVLGTSERVRPVLMTSITTILGVLPLIINSDSEKNFWYSFSVTTIGGLTASTIFVLTVVPVMYAFFERGKIVARDLFSNRSKLF
ncbi:MAG: efflux RND transporter permease subunit [Candidatus Delongbacteria bacterium]|nr:efflux RND transporter permease subunit [Candidatus Delongbacteria bacterium]